MDSAVSRNDPCPCGSRLKFKRCCLPEEQRAQRDARLADAVGRRLQDWSSEAFSDEIGTASTSSWDSTG